MEADGGSDCSGIAGLGGSSAVGASSGPTAGSSSELAALFRRRGEGWQRRFVRAMNEIALRQASRAAATSAAAQEEGAEEDAVERLSMCKSSRWVTELPRHAPGTRMPIAGRVTGRLRYTAFPTDETSWMGQPVLGQSPAGPCSRLGAAGLGPCFVVAWVLE